VRILVLSFYYEPDLCPGSFRNSSLVKSLSRKLGRDDSIDVISIMPGRYASFTLPTRQHERNGNVNIRRVPLVAYFGGFSGQVRQFLRYAWVVFKETRGESYDLVYASSSRLMTAVLGGGVARLGRFPLYIDIRDIFTESLRDVFPRSPVRLFLPLFRMLERWVLHTASRINLVSPAFESYFIQVNPGRKYRHFTNGVDLDVVQTNGDRQPLSLGSKEILYAGNIGEGQGLHEIIPNIARVLPQNWRITIIGDGVCRNRLEQCLVGLDNVSLEKPVPRSELSRRYSRATILFLHLNRHAAFRRVIPSKLFEYAATGKPILAGVQGYPSEFIERNVDNAEVFTPGDESDCLRAFYALHIKHTPRESFCREYSRSRISDRMADDLIDLASCGHQGLAQEI